MRKQGKLREESWQSSKCFHSSISPRRSQLSSQIETLDFGTVEELLGRCRLNGFALIQGHSHDRQLIRPLRAFCSTSKKEIPCWFKAVIVAKISSTTSGERPRDGSSRRTSFGLSRKILDRASIWRKPPDSDPAGLCQFVLHPGKGCE